MTHDLTRALYRTEVPSAAPSYLHASLLPQNVYNGFAELAGFFQALTFLHGAESVSL